MLPLSSTSRMSFQLSMERRVRAMKSGSLMKMRRVLRSKVPRFLRIVAFGSKFFAMRMRERRRVRVP